MERTAKADRELIVDLAISHCDEEGSWLICDADGCNVGDDVD